MMYQPITMNRQQGSHQPTDSRLVRSHTIRTSLRSMLKSITAITALVLSVLFIGASSGLAQTAEESIFLELPGIPGNATTEGFEGQIVLNSYRQVYTDSTLLKKGKLQCKVVLTKIADTASPLLWAAAVSGEVFEQATVNLVAGGDAYAEFTMDSAKILKILIAEGDEEFRNSPNSDARPGEKFIMTYSAMNFRSGTTTRSWTCPTP